MFSKTNRHAMSTILSDIIANKKEEIIKLKALSTIEKFEQNGFFWNFANRSLVQRLKTDDNTGIIAEFKRKSPSKGWFKTKELEVEPVVVPYNYFGAAGISVLTDDVFFGGDLDDLIQTKIITNIPILRKDFIIDAWQIAESKAFGADVILLIAAILSVSQTRQLALYAKSIGLEVLLEIHNESELGHICDEVDMVGVNNRNLENFEVDIEISLKLIDKIKEKIAIAESGIGNIEKIKILRKAGFRGFLIGETFMKTENPGLAFKLLAEQLKTTE
jgi:indole-3-glycerol phosphate synthase